LAEVIVLLQQGQVFELKSKGASARWAYRHRVGGRGSRRVQRGGYESEQAATEALERALERLRRERGLVEAPTLTELVDVYLAQHGGEPETVEKLRWLLAKAVNAFEDRRISQLRPAEIAAWRMTIPTGHRLRRPRRYASYSPVPSAGGCSTSTRPSRESTTRNAAAQRSAIRVMG
jgi:hypothetical protein